MSTATDQEEQSLLDAIEGPIEPVQTPGSYKLALLLASLVMVALPLIYVCVALAFAWLVWFHAVNSVVIFGEIRGRGAIMALIIYVAPLVAGVTAVLFMFKPLFSRPPKQDKPISLSRSDESQLFDFVDRLCDTVHAPRPKRIDVDCQVNASAGFRNGWLSMLLGNDLVLTIGLPLVAGMSLRQFGGILAHEFGHFAQGGGMRLTYVIRTVSHWFTRVVYERDSWDQNLERWSREYDLRIGIIFYLARGCVWLTRRILWVLMMVGHSVSGMLLRQMEFDADRHEVRFSGSSVIEPTTRRLHELMVAHEMAQGDLAQAYQDGRLADDLIQLISLNADDLPDDIEQQIDKSLNEGSTGWLDTHPCDRERIASGERENAPGVFHLEVPATALFANMQDVSRRATSNMYRTILGDEFRTDQLHSVEELVAAREAQKRAANALSSFFQNGWTALQAVHVPFLKLPEAESAASEAGLSDLRESMLSKMPKQHEAVKQILAADDGLADCSRAGLLLDANFSVPADTFSRNLSSKDRVQKESDQFNQEWTAAEADYTEFLAVATDRLWRSLSLLTDETVRNDFGDAERWQEECDTRLIPALRKLMSEYPSFMDLRSDSDRFLMCLQLLSNGNETQELYDQTRNAMTTLGTKIGDLQKALGEVAYPFEHAESDMTLARYVCPKLPTRENPGEHYEAITTLVQNYLQLYQRIMARLTEMAQAVEEHLGLPPLPVPETDEKSESEVSDD